MDPAPVALFAAGMMTLLLGLAMIGWLNGGTVIMVPLALAFGGTGQVIVGLLELRRGNPFGFTVFTSFGGFWWYYGLLNAPILPGGVAPMSTFPLATFGWTLVMWGLFSMMMWVATFRMSAALTVAFAWMTAAYLLLGAGAIDGVALVNHLGGAAAIGATVCAFYIAWGIVLKASWGRAVLPMGRSVAELLGAPAIPPGPKPSVSDPIR